MRPAGGSRDVQDIALRGTTSKAKGKCFGMEGRKKLLVHKREWEGQNLDMHTGKEGAF